MASRAEICWVWLSICPTCRIWASPLSISIRSFSPRPTIATTPTTTITSIRSWAATKRCARCWTRRTGGGCGWFWMGSLTTPAAVSSSSTTSSRMGPSRPTWTGSSSTTTRCDRITPQPASTATRHGGGCRPCPSSMWRRRPCASFYGISPATGSSLVLTAGGWTYRPKSTTMPSGRSSGDGSGRSIPRPTSWVRSGRRRAAGCRATSSTR